MLRPYPRRWPASLLAATLAFGALPTRAFAAADPFDAVYGQAADADHKHDCKTAAALYRRGLTMLEDRGARPDEARMINVQLNLAVCEHVLGQERDGYNRLSALMPRLEALSDFPPAELALTYNRLGEMALALHHWGDEADALGHAVAAARRDPKYDPLDRFDIAIREAIALMRDGKLDDGRKLEADVLAEHVSTRALAAGLPGTLNSLGNDLENAGFHADAIAIYDRLIATIGPKPTEILGVSHYNKALSLRALGREDEAFEAHRRAYDILRAVQGPDGPKALNALGGMGQAYGMAGHPALALPFLGEAFARAQKALGPDDSLTLMFENNLADIERQLARPAEAAAHDRDALARRLILLGPSDFETIVSHLNLALDLQMQGRLDDALAVIRKLVALLEGALGADHGETWRARFRLAKLTMLNGDLPGAAVQYADAMARGGLDKVDPGLRSTVENAMATLADRQGKGANAAALYQRAFDDSVSASGADSFDALTAEANLLSILAEAKDADVTPRVSGLNARVVAWSAREVAANRDPAVRDRLLSLFRTTRGLAVDAALQRPTPQNLAALVETMERWKGLGLREDRLLAKIIAGGDPAAAKSARLVADSLRPGAEGAELVAAERARADLAKVSPTYAQALKRAAPSAADIAAALPEGEAFIDYWVTPLRSLGEKDGDHVIATVMTREGVAGVKDLGAVGAIQAILANGALARSSAAGAVFARALVAPLGDAVQGAKAVTVAPDGALFLVPFAAIAAGRSGQPWTNDKPVKIVRSAASLLVVPAPSQATGVLIFDDIDYGHSKDGDAVPRLGRTEGPAIAASMKGAGLGLVELRTGKAASKAALFAMTHPPKILHLSTHAGYEPPDDPNEDPLDWASVALAGANADPLGGVMSAREAARLKLEGAELVTLSACETAAGSATYAEGLAGLPSALAIAGAKRTLLALWPVSSVGATAFMTRFYAHLAKAPEDFEGAFRATQLEIIGGAAPEAAEDWRAFTLMRN